MENSNSEEIYCIITVDVYCTDITNAPRYRVFVDNYLITERNFVFDEQYVRENIFVNLAPGEHTFHLECETDNFTYTNLTVNDRLLGYEPRNKVTSFSI